MNFRGLRDVEAAFFILVWSVLPSITGVGNLSLVAGQRQILQGLAGRINFPPTIPFPSLLMMLLKLDKLCNFNQINS